ncbi:MAG: hypothetical protein COV29_01180 [Candidatus Yanofskybacteria bacterium CG10_big_fil_rev_8_21_14_0_10_36_16]|uniref:TVP38/TMEM64 family membrane protein n=1 Tax=Candidatus Yanofskybacteria bacterium CG10_big_fil_rev_8_21_14_0_10_36_16 TaxID=1975096 RepID=A0A2J0Q875_9BACT|nr:MAG: hypothetical protein COV29_01180 [Candidatus Yanofskybacteria bacterium CG10_big_fil_rev_8_21_14_0_10_36_16]
MPFLYGQIDFIKKNWPFLIPLVMIFLNVELIIIPGLMTWGMGGFELFVVSSIIATLSLFVWHVFWMWFIKNKIEPLSQKDTIKDDIKFGREMAVVLSEKGYFDQAKNYFVKKYYKIFHPSNPFIKKIKTGGYMAMASMVIFLPYPGVRTSFVVFCCATKWQRGFIFLIFCNICRMAYITGIWTLIFYFASK